MVIDRAIIMAAGAGRRMKSKSSKPMTKVGAKKLIQYGIDALRGCDIKTIYIIYSDYSKDVLSLRRIYTDINFVRQELVDGSLSTFLLAGEICSTPFLMLDCDIILFWQDLSKMLHSIKEQSTACGYFAVVSKPLPDSPKYIRISNHQVIDFEKHGFDDGCSGGMIYLWNSFPLEDTRAFYARNQSLSSYFKHLVKRQVIGAMYIEQLWDVDTMSEVILTEKILEERNEDKG